MKVGLAACSNGLDPDCGAQIDELCGVLERMGAETERAPHMFASKDDFSGTDEERAGDLMRFYGDDSIDAIYDVSGGDLANGVLNHLDFGLIARSPKLFWGYSDLTSVINAIYAKTGRPSVLYQIRNLVWEDSELQQRRFSGYISGRNGDLFDIRYSFLQGRSMEGAVVGGNLRCFLKLAGTEFWPDLTGKIILLESYGGGSGRIASMFCQLGQTGAFEKASGILLGTFTAYSRADLILDVFDLLKMHIPGGMPVARTPDVGHGSDARAVMIGKHAVFG